MTERVPKTILLAGGIGTAAVLALFAYARPGYFSSQTYLGGLLLLEFLAVAVWLYRQVFFPLVLVAFLLAGTNLHLGSIWMMARWVVLGVGAGVGLAMMLKERGHRFASFHVLALFAVLAALVSAAVSRYTTLSFSKVLSLFVLFLYAATGVRLAVSGRESRFFAGLVNGCEAFVALVAAAYWLGFEVMGNPNSLGAVMGVVAAPVLLWGTLLKQEAFAHRRRLFLYAVAMYLTFSSHARAGMLAALVSCGLLCLVLRKYRLLAQGVAIIAILVAAAAIIQPEAFSRTVSSVTSTVVYKGHRTEGLMSSRKSPWEDTIDVIHEHFWFGTGFGTSDNGQVAATDIGRFTSTSATSTEHGSSYLAITAWVGMLGVLPFFLLVGGLVLRVARTLVWMSKTGNPSHAAVPLAIVVLAGLIHAGFEDWLFAPGYYLCVFFWSLAFVLVDQTPALPVMERSGMFFWRARSMPQEFGTVAPSR